MESKPLWVKALYVFVFVCTASGCGLAAVGVVAFLSSCSPKVAAVQTQYTVTEGAHSVELAKCLADTKADSGRLEDFCVCWVAVNAKYNVDAGACR